MGKTRTLVNIVGSTHELNRTYVLGRAGHAGDRPWATVLMRDAKSSPASGLLRGRVVPEYGEGVRQVLGATGLKVMTAGRSAYCSAVCRNTRPIVTNILPGSLMVENGLSFF